MFFIQKRNLVFTAGEYENCLRRKSGKSHKLIPARTLRIAQSACITRKKCRSDTMRDRRNKPRQNTILIEQPRRGPHMACKSQKSSQVRRRFDHLIKASHEKPPVRHGDRKIKKKYTQGTLQKVQQKGFLVFIAKPFTFCQTRIT